MIRDTELIIACYQKPEYLRLVLQTVVQQEFRPASVCIADDGSESEVLGVINEFTELHSNLVVRHVWQKDLGFRKNTILNKAISSSERRYLIFIDDDCLMHPGFVKRHVNLAKKSRFLTGSLIRLSTQFTKNLLASGSVDWSKKQTLKGWSPQSYSEFLKSSPMNLNFMSTLDALSPMRTSWAGCNSSGFRDEILAVNGFDETMGYGGGDKEFGVRLKNSGVVGRHVRYCAPLYHLSHDRGYVDEQTLRVNREKIIVARREGRVWTKHGINQRSR